MKRRASVRKPSWTTESDLGTDSDLFQAGVRGFTTAIAFVVVLGFAGVVIFMNVDPALTDARADWLAVSAALDDLDPWQDLRELAPIYNTEFGSIGASELGEFDRVHPRTPGALLLLMPLALVSAEQAYSAMLIVIIASAALTALVVTPTFGWGAFSTTTLISVGLLGSTAFLATLEFGTHSLLILLTVATTWALVRNGDSTAAGISLGIAIALRLFPGLLLIPLLARRQWRALLASLLTFVALNTLGLAAYGLSLADVVDGLTAAGGEWMAFGGNGSLAMPLARLGLDPSVAGASVVAVGVAAAFAISSRGRTEGIWSVVIVLALLASPLSWEHYDVLGFLVLGLVWSVYGAQRVPRVVGLLLALWLLFQLVGGSVDNYLGTATFSLSGSLSLAGRLVLLAAALLAWRDTWDGEASSAGRPEEVQLGVSITPLR